MNPDPIRTLGEKVALEHDRVRRPDEYLGGIKERVLEVTPRAHPLSHKRRLQALVAAAALLGLVALGIGLSRRTSSALIGVIEGTGETIAIGEWISTSRPTALRFSEGTKLTLNAATRARLLSAQASGAHLLVEMGRVEVDVIPHQSANWKITTGPFQVHVKGTQFSVRWDPEHDQFELDLRRGTVIVSGCVFGEGRTVEPGETVRAECRSGQFHVTHNASSQAKREDADAASKPAVTEGANDTADPDASTVEHNRPTPSSAPAADGWRGMIREGRYAQAFQAAEALGFEKACQTASPSELSSLGDGARYAGAIAKATAAYKTLRQRFPGTDRAATAAFSLARIEFDQRGAYAEAARWFRTYLREQPRGHLAREARGRLMEALERAGDLRGAKEAARAYLEVYSDGPHAAPARALVGAAAQK